MTAALLRLSAFAFLLAAGGSTAQEARGDRPAPDCLDARAIAGSRSLTTGELLVRTPAERFVVDFAPECRGSLGEPDRLLSPQGWVCGRAGEFAEAEGVSCPIAQVRRIEAREYARLTEEDDRRRPPTLDPVTVQARTRPAVIGYRGDPEYCFSVRAVRGWALDGNDVIVQTAPRRSSGRKQYRVRLALACPELTWNDNIAFVSSIDSGLICGNPGDHIVTSSPFEGMLTNDVIPTGGPSLQTRLSCRISDVYADD